MAQSLNPDTSSRTAEAEAEKPVTDPGARHDALEMGRRVLRLEAKAVEAVADTLDGAFVEAVEILARLSGSDGARVVVTGMGKSGHIARKIAATLASTGTPAQFVHPAEASHGDLGMITEKDAVLALSNSGETKELSDLLQYCKRYDIPLLAMTARPASALARYADVALILPDQPEAATMGLAPTTSTTMSLALGDALAVALLERKGFTATDFRLFHPGGKLGQQLMRVGDLMHRGEEVPLVDQGISMDQAVLTITSKHFGCTGVTDAGGRLVGIVTDGDLRRHMSPDLMQKTAGEVMTADPMTVNPDIMASETLALMNERRITALFIVDRAGKPTGIVHMHDFLRTGVA